jgi:hypothetical protein
VLLACCSVYDASLVENTGAVSVWDASVEAAPNETGSAAVSGSVSTGISGGSGDVLDNSGNDAGALPQLCGDGLLQRESGETCDIAIASGTPGACPTSCPTQADCKPRALAERGCQTACVRVDGELGCKSDDGCCPESCTHSNDSDCSARCGDGIIQKESGETCEPGSATPCQTSAEECTDGNACTVDTLSGSSAHCDVTCVHVENTLPMPNDGCCPPGANATTDNDCPAKCGNNIVEPGEVCDSREGCDPTCQIKGTTDQLRCLSGAASECERCACLHCTATEVACRLNDDATIAKKCDDMVDCSATNACNDGASCYCGPLVVCLGPPYGPCKGVIDAATGDTKFEAATSQANDRTTAVGRATAADSCRIDQCKGVCR